MEHATTYNPPQLRDYGTLLELIAAVDVNIVGAVTNVVMAAMSNPIGPKATDPSIQSGGAGGVLGGGGGGGAGGAGSGGGGGGSGLAHLLSGKGSGGGGGKLPFTGFPVVLLAAVGAMVASVGAVLRTLLRRGDRPET